MKTINKNIMTLVEINKERNALQERRDNLEITLKRFIVRLETLNRLEAKLTSNKNN